MISYNDESTANALQRPLDNNPIIQATPHNIRRTGIKGHLLGVYDQGFKRYTRLRRCLGSFGTDALGRAVNKIMLPPIAVSVCFTSLRLLCVAVVLIITVADTT